MVYRPIDMVYRITLFSSRVMRAHAQTKKRAVQGCTARGVLVFFILGYVTENG